MAEGAIRWLTRRPRRPSSSPPSTRSRRSVRRVAVVDRARRRARSGCSSRAGQAAAVGARGRGRRRRCDGLRARRRRSSGCTRCCRSRSASSPSSSGCRRRRPSSIARGLEDAQAVGRLDEAGQRSVVLAILRRETRRDGARGDRRRVPRAAGVRDRRSRLRVRLVLAPRPTRSATGRSSATSRPAWRSSRATGRTGPTGLTTNAITSVSLEPLLLLVCFDNGSRTLPAVREARRFAVNVLRAGQDDLARVFASKRVAREKFEAVTHMDAHGVPVLDGALAWLACDLESTAPRGRPHDRHRRDHAHGRGPGRASRSCGSGATTGRSRRSARIAPEGDPARRCAELARPARRRPWTVLNDIRSSGNGGNPVGAGPPRRALSAAARP